VLQAITKFFNGREMWENMLCSGAAHFLGLLAGTDTDEIPAEIAGCRQVPETVSDVGDTAV